MPGPVEMWVQAAGGRVLVRRIAESEPLDGEVADIHEGDQQLAAPRHALGDGGIDDYVAVGPDVEPHGRDAPQPPEHRHDDEEDGHAVTLKQAAHSCSEGRRGPRGSRDGR